MNLSDFEIKNLVKEDLWVQVGVKGTTWFQAPKMAKKFIFLAGKESSKSATTDSETLGVCGE